jgi:hypothetical protein
LRIVTVCFALLLAASASAQTTTTEAEAPEPAPEIAAAWNGLPDRFQVDAGYFRIDANTALTYDSPQSGEGVVDLEDDTGLPEKVSTFWVEGRWRVGRRHQLLLGVTNIARERTAVSLERDFVWGGEDYTAGMEADVTGDSTVLGGYYRFALLRKDRYEIGPTLGFGYLWVDTRIRATGTVDGVSRSLDEGAETGAPTGAIGAYGEVWPAKRLVLRGDFLYIKVGTDNKDDSVKDWRLVGNYYFTKHVGVGLQYKYVRYARDLHARSTDLGGELRFKGFQVFGTFLF